MPRNYEPKSHVYRYDGFTVAIVTVTDDSPCFGARFSIHSEIGVQQSAYLPLEHQGSEGINHLFDAQAIDAAKAQANKWIDEQSADV